MIFTTRNGTPGTDALGGRLGSWKNPVKASTGASITLRGERAIDTVDLVAGDRVLVRAQDNAAQNGIYEVRRKYWVRAGDCDTVVDAYSGICVVVIEGEERGGTAWRLATPDPIVLGTTELEWAPFGGAPEVQIGGEAPPLDGTILLWVDLGDDPVVIT